MGKGILIPHRPDEKVFLETIVAIHLRLATDMRAGLLGLTKVLSDTPVQHLLQLVLVFVPDIGHECLASTNHTLPCNMRLKLVLADTQPFKKYRLLRPPFLHVPTISDMLYFVKGPKENHPSIQAGVVQDPLKLSVTYLRRTSSRRVFPQLAFLPSFPQPSEPRVP